MGILKEADAGVPVNEIWFKYGISSATYDKWKANYRGLEAPDSFDALEESVFLMHIAANPGVVQ